MIITNVINAVHLLLQKFSLDLPCIIIITLTACMYIHTIAVESDVDTTKYWLGLYQ